MSEDLEIQMCSQLYELRGVQAQEVLEAFLKTEAEAFPRLKIDSIDLDYSQQSVVEALHHVVTEVEAGRLNEEQRNLWFMRLGYYLGEALRKANPALSWGLGDSEYAFANHPVIAGFADDEEAPVITICRNVVVSVAEGRSPGARIENTVRNWFGTPTV
jgi:hypothetical protein